MTQPVPEQWLPENQDPDVNYTVFGGTGQRVDLDDKGKPTVEMAANGFPKDPEDGETAEPANQADREKMPKAKNFSPQAKKDQNLDGHGDKKADEK